VKTKFNINMTVPRQVSEMSLLWLAIGLLSTAKHRYQPQN